MHDGAGGGRGAMTVELPAVAVVTRTKNRPLLFARAAASVRAQSSRDLVWVVVNDGGEAAPVEAIVDTNRTAGIACVVVHHEHSRGMEAASNAGLAAAASRYVVIHDDDDSWAPDFLARTVGFLDDEPRYGGVVTGFRNVAERVRGADVKHITSWDARPVHGALQMADLVRVNPFPPICFLYRRSVLDELGGYREDLPVLGDWEFNLRFLERWDIAALPDLLANYHHRFGTAGPLGNTIHAGIDRHAAYDALLRNEWLRRDLAAGREGLGHLLLAGRQAELLRMQWQRPLRGLRRRALLALDRLAERLGR